MKNVIVVIAMLVAGVAIAADVSAEVIYEDDFEGTTWGAPLTGWDKLGPGEMRTLSGWLDPAITPHEGDRFIRPSQSTDPTQIVQYEQVLATGAEVIQGEASAYMYFRETNDDALWYVKSGDDTIGIGMQAGNDNKLVYDIGGTLTATAIDVPQNQWVEVKFAVSDAGTTASVGGVDLFTNNSYMTSFDTIGFLVGNQVLMGMDTVQVDGSVVPEPGSLVIMAMASGVFAFTRRRRHA